jgi:chromosomal replication initiation ATPase DnaA
MTQDERELVLVEKLSRANRKLGRALYLLEMIMDEESIKERNAKKIRKFLMESKRSKKISNTPIKVLAENLIDIVFRYYELPTVARHIKSRKREYVYARQMSMFMLHEHFSGTLNLSDIGLFFKKDHATVIHSKNVIQDGLDIGEKTITEDVENLRILTNSIYE